MRCRGMMLLVLQLMLLVLQLMLLVLQLMLLVLQLMLLVLQVYDCSEGGTPRRIFHKELGQTLHCLHVGRM